MLKIYNTLSRSVEEFNPISKEEVGIYTCGPTVYNFPHIGNLRTFVFSDILQRVLKFNNFKIKSVQNITDIDDKIIKKAKEENVEIEEVTNKFTDYFFQDIKKLNIEEKNQINSASVNIKSVSQTILTHYRAFNVPPWSPFSPRRIIRKFSVFF